jgi:hypothetical protein
MTHIRTNRVPGPGPGGRHRPQLFRHSEGSGGEPTVRALIQAPSGRGRVPFRGCPLAVIKNIYF